MASGRRWDYINDQPLAPSCFRVISDKSEGNGDDVSWCEDGGTEQKIGGRTRGVRAEDVEVSFGNNEDEQD